MALSTVMIPSCKKAEVKPKEPVKEVPVKKCFELSKMVDVNWKPIYSGYDAPNLLQSGEYYEGGHLIGTWSTNQCDCVIIKNASIPENNFFFKIAKLNSDSLQVITARFGVTLFKK